MTDVIFILPILFSFLEVAGFSIPLLSTSIVLFAIFRNDNWPYILAFISGILFDVLSVGTLGKSSIVLLVIVLVISAYRRRFQVNNLFFAVVAAVLSGLLFSLIVTSQALNVSLISKLFVTALGVSLVWYGLYKREETHEAWS